MSEEQGLSEQQAFILQYVTDNGGATMGEIVAACALQDARLKRIHDEHLQVRPEHCRLVRGPDED